MNEFNYDWTQFTREIFIQAGVPAVFEAWAKPNEITKWFIAATDQERSAEKVVQVGDQYRWHWHQGAHAQGTFLEVIENEKNFNFTFGDEATYLNEKIVVTVQFTDLGNMTSVLLTQENLPDTEQGHVQWHMGCNMGWSFFYDEP